MPPLVGMLVSGLLLRNVPFIGDHVGAKIQPAWSAAVRSLALTLILCRAGLSLDLSALKRLRFVVTRLAIMPGLSEAATIAALATALLEFPIEWAAMLGFVIAAISPAVVIPSLLSLRDRGFGVKTGIPPMVVAAAALDDVIAISGFGICYSFALGGSTQKWLHYARAPLELTMGPLIGVTAGCMLALLMPSRLQDPRGREWRAALLLGAAVSVSFALTRASFAGASALSVLCLASSAAQGWGNTDAKAVGVLLGDIWNHLAQPLLFGFVGAAVSMQGLTAWILGYGFAMLSCSLLVRFVVTFVAVGCHGLRKRERVFAALAWLPKATVQAAIGGIALDSATTQRQQKMGRDILAFAVLSILVTAPLGAGLIELFGPRLLVRDDEAKHVQPEVKEFCSDPDLAAVSGNSELVSDSANHAIEE
eukprot:TRINITY_DN4662_c0_g2_i1.p1 TRINITY_DN4662_c0_g2~~TRINITY_DN4662_c0_g2_i1.p1  ORF type:complete len:422 (+),score=58.29 TRINITY_DN4662_c0_g2_i1:132-1397(+)